MIALGLNTEYCVESRKNPKDRLYCFFAVLANLISIEGYQRSMGGEMKTSGKVAMFWRFVNS